MKIYVGNISYDSNDEELFELFSQYGSVESATIVTYRDSGRSRGFGFVEMPNDEEALEAIHALDGYVLRGRPLRVNKSHERRSHRGSSNWNRRY